MSVPYLAMPLTAELFPWLREHGHSVDTSATGRWPLLDELRAAAELPGHAVQLRQDDKWFELAIDSVETATFPCDGEYQNTIAPGVAVAPVSFLHLRGSGTPGSSIQRLSGHGDRELLIAVLKRLAKTCGPQVFCAEEDCVPGVITE